MFKYIVLYLCIVEALSSGQIREDGLINQGSNKHVVLNKKHQSTDNSCEDCGNAKDKSADIAANVRHASNRKRQKTFEATSREGHKKPFLKLHQVKIEINDDDNEENKIIDLNEKHPHVDTDMDQVIDDIEFDEKLETNEETNAGLKEVSKVEPNEKTKSGPNEMLGDGLKVISEASPNENSKARPNEKSEARPKEKSKARPSENSEAIPNENTEAIPKEKSESRPKEKSESRPKEKSESRPNKKSEARPNEKSEARSNEKSNSKSNKNHRNKPKNRKLKLETKSNRTKHVQTTNEKTSPGTTKNNAAKPQSNVPIVKTDKDTKKGNTSEIDKFLTLVDNYYKDKSKSLDQSDSTHDKKNGEVHSSNSSSKPKTNTHLEIESDSKDGTSVKNDKKGVSGVHDNQKKKETKAEKPETFVDTVEEDDDFYMVKEDTRFIESQENEQTNKADERETNKQNIGSQEKRHREDEDKKKHSPKVSSHPIPKSKQNIGHSKPGEKSQIKEKTSKVHKDIVSEIDETKLNTTFNTGNGKFATDDLLPRDTDGTGEVKADVDVIIPEKADDRWSREGLDAVAGVARLERKLHPTVDAPVRDITLSMQRLLVRLQGLIGTVVHDYVHINNVTRWHYMTGVRTQLSSLRQHNDRIYTVVLESSLLTKQIYRRAHERRRPNQFRYDSSPVADLRYRSRKSENAAHNAIQHAMMLKQQIAVPKANYDMMYDKFLRLRQEVVSGIPVRALYDLGRRANQTIRRLTIERPLRQQAYRRTGSGTGIGLADAKYLVARALTIVSETKKNLMVNQKRFLADVPAFQGRGMSLWPVVDAASNYATDLMHRAGSIDMILSPVLNRAAKMLTGGRTSNMQKIIQNTVNGLSKDTKELTRVLDKIRVLIGDTRFLQERCEMLEGSGMGIGDDEDDDDYDDVMIIDCSQYIETIPEGSGDRTDEIISEGSGDISEPIYSNETTGLLLTDEGEIIDDKIDGDFTFIDGDLEEDGHEVDKVVDTSEESKLPQPEMTKPKPTKHAEHVTTAPPEVTTQKQIMTSSPKDDVTTTITPVVTTATKERKTTTEESKGVLDIFSFWNDAPAGHPDMTNEPSTLNEAIRERLYNYSATSKMVKEEAEGVAKLANDLSGTWSKVQSRFAVVDNGTREARAQTLKARTWISTAEAMHDYVTEAVEHIDTQVDVTEKLCKTATEIAAKKVKTYEELYDKNKDRLTSAPSDDAINDARDAVPTVASNAREIARLVRVRPDPCGTLERYDLHIRGNITSLRDKIERARLLAASMQLSVEVPTERQVVAKVDVQAVAGSLLTDRVQLHFRPSQDTGHLFTVDYNDTGSVEISLKSGRPSVTQTLNGDDTSVSADTSLQTDSWYTLLIERFANTHTLSLTNTSGSSARLSVKGTQPFLLQDTARPTHVTIGGEETAGGCIGGLTVNGRVTSLGEVLSRSCPSNMVFQDPDLSVLLDGGGYGRYSLDRHRSIRELEVTFTPLSDGAVFSLGSRYLRTKMAAIVSAGRLHVYLEQNTMKTSLATKHKILGEKLTLSLRTDARRDSLIQVNGASDVFDDVTDARFDILSNHRNGLVVGSMLTNISSMSGCVAAVKVNGADVELQRLEGARGVKFGSCQQSECVSFTSSSRPLEMSDVEDGDRVFLSVHADALGQVLEYNKTGKVSIAVILGADGEVTITESLNKEESKRTFDSDNLYHTISVMDSPDDKEVKVTVARKTFEFSYKENGGGGGGWGWGGKEEDAEDDVEEEDEEAGYDITLGGNPDKPFVGDLLELIIGDTSLKLRDFLSSNKLHRCSRKVPKSVTEEPIQIKPRVCG
ncbi:uncharacterized protein LOC128212024 [Mya arenaria]|uniref:uncharacterized protein LOC128212024 n=1 Tax=Mya arenaria TaxID=6604 RepID=UPI0022E59D12|nr:uncharacterized protein LOC128212024 [Mya arenaria]